MNLKLRYVLIYLFIVTLVAVGISFSRFRTIITNTGSENTIPPDIEFSTWVMDHKTATVSLENMVPGESRNINIWVKNWKVQGGELLISDYDQSFKIELETTGNLPLKFTLTERPEGEADLFSAVPFGYISDSCEFIAGEQSTKEFVLTVTWPEDKRDELYKKEIDYIEIRLKAVQS